MALPLSGKVATIIFEAETKFLPRYYRYATSFPIFVAYCIGAHPYLQAEKSQSKSEYSTTTTILRNNPYSVLRIPLLFIAFAFMANNATFRLLQKSICMNLQIHLGLYARMIPDGEMQQ